MIARTLRCVAILVVLYGAIAGTTARAGTFKAALCSYFQHSGDDYDGDGPCTLRDTTLHGHFAYIVTFDNGRVFRIEYVSAQGPNHQWLINGAPAVGFEMNREHLIGITRDHSVVIEWKDRLP